MATICAEKKPKKPTAETTREEGKTSAVHDTTQDEKKPQWESPTNSYAFEMGFHPDNVAGL